VTQGKKARWYERFPGHFFLYLKHKAYDVHVCIRGDNCLRPVAMVSIGGGGPNLFWEQCVDVKEAQEKAQGAYRRILLGLLEEVND
jgi:hypothetical protein